MTATTERRRVVVGVDGSKSSVNALRWARRVAVGLDAELDVVICWAYPSSYGVAAGPPDWNPADDADKAMSNAVAEAFGADAPLGLTSSVHQGHASEVLLHASLGAELLVVGSRGHGGFVSLLIGSVSAHCAEHALCPVLVVHDTEPPSGPVPAPTTDAS